MKDLNKTYWKSAYSELSKSDNILVQMGKGGYSMLNFFASVKDVDQQLKFERTDIVLDVAGGAGWYSIVFSPFVERIFLFDYTEELIQHAKTNIVPFPNIIPFVDDVCTFDETRRVLTDAGLSGGIDKIIVGGVLQILSDYEHVESVFRNVFSVLKNGGKALFTQVPDLRRKEAHIASYDRLDWPKEKIEHDIDINKNKTLWFDMEIVSKMAQKANGTSVYIATI